MVGKELPAELMFEEKELKFSQDSNLGHLSFCDLTGIQRIEV